ncbi:Enhanced disease resistance 2 [Abeliophyllum distichum]|uniref:Enhanced disease resistance 2 n=1 Tax=Abeliophyllum distichum TaxID=126358 RepID=A0ABD1Q8E9_9LAMI
MFLHKGFNSENHQSMPTKSNAEKMLPHSIPINLQPATEKMFPHPIPIIHQPAAESDSQTMLRHPFFDCFTVNGVLCPDPISWALPDETPVEMEMEEQPRTSLAEAGKGKRKRTKTVVDKVEMVMFQLFKTLIKGKEGYILQMHKIETQIIINYHFSVDEKNGIKEVKVEACPKGELKAELVTEETSLNVQTKCKLSLQERLVGWTYEARKRRSSNITDKYFIHSHGKAKKTFRSVKELGNFILFCSSVQVSSHRRKAKMTEKEKKEAFLANRQNMDEIVVPLCYEDNAAEGDEDGIFSEVLEHPITDL